jgi:hypothetical protein
MTKRKNCGVEQSPSAMCASLALAPQVGDTIVWQCAQQPHVSETGAAEVLQGGGAGLLWQRATGYNACGDEHEQRATHLTGWAPIIRAGETPVVEAEGAHKSGLARNEVDAGRPRLGHNL